MYPDAELRPYNSQSSPSRVWNERDAIAIAYQAGAKVNYNTFVLVTLPHRLIVIFSPVLHLWFSGYGQRYQGSNIQTYQRRTPFIERSGC